MKTFRRTLALALVLILALSALSFAGTSTMGNGEARKLAGSTATVGNGEMKKLDGERLDATKEKMELPLYQKYALELYDEMLALKNEHQAIHAEITAIKEELTVTKESRKEEVQAFMTQMREKYAEAVKNKEMTREEVKAQIKLEIEEQFGPLGFGEYKEELKALKVQLEANKEARLEIREQIRTALAIQDTAPLKGLLTRLAELRREHVALDQGHLDILEEILEEQN